MMDVLMTGPLTETLLRMRRKRRRRPRPVQRLSKLTSLPPPRRIGAVMMDVLMTGPLMVSQLLLSPLLQFAPAAGYQVTEDWSAPTETSDWAAASSEQAAPNWGGSNQW